MIEQGTPEWHAMRLGKATASRIRDIIATTKSGVSASRAGYLAELVAERLTGEAGDNYSSPAMQRGNELEPAARSVYEFQHDVTVDQVSFIDHPVIVMTGASPDGLVGTDGLVEIKCPGAAKHLSSLMGSSIDGHYITQMQWQMACTGRAWCDFVSYNPSFPHDMQLHVRRVERVDETIAQLEEKVAAFLAEVGETVANLRARYSIMEGV